MNILENNHRLDDENEGGGFSIKNITSIILTVVAVSGLIASIFLQLGDFKVSDTEIRERLRQVEVSVAVIQKRIDDLEIRGSRPLETLKTTLEFEKREIESLQREIDSLKETLAEHDAITRRAIGARGK